MKPNPFAPDAVVERVMRKLAREIDGMELPAIEKISESQQEDPFQVLISTLLSARTQDATTLAASTRLFKKARTPATMARLTVKQIERLICKYAGQLGGYLHDALDLIGLYLRSHHIAIFF